VEKIKLREAEIIYIKDFLPPKLANEYFNILLEDLKWEQHYIKIFGKTLAQPRLSALYAENDESLHLLRSYPPSAKISSRFKRASEEIS
jgi:hypothetical protein